MLPSLDALNKLQAEKRILVGGLKVGERAFVFVAEAESNEKSYPSARRPIRASNSCATLSSFSMSCSLSSSAKAITPMFEYARRIFGPHSPMFLMVGTIRENRRG